MNITGAEVLQARHIHAMATRMVHRGPDDEGYLLIRKNGTYQTYLGDDTPKGGAGSSSVPEYPQEHIMSALDRPSLLALGHRRLSIVDLSPHGHQPMCTRNGRYWVVYNGEIYNYSEIAEDLLKEGVHLHGHSDTEILINAYATWGECCLERFNGMFAFAIWDNREKTLFCARDRIGIKPFYYTLQAGQLIFASDIKTLIASGLYTPDVDMRGLYLAMAFGIAPRPLTAFKDVVALEQAHWMKIYTDGRIEKRRYWSIPVGTQDHRMSESEAIETLEEQLTASVKRRLIADVPVGTFMSGGIDSTTISAIASNLHPGIKAFTLAYGDASPEFDEVPQARATAALHPMEHIVSTVDPVKILNSVERIIRNYEEPASGLAANSQISRIVSEHNTTVVLNGLGGDELFAGYRWYSWLHYWRTLRRVKPLVNIAPYVLGARGKRLGSISRIVSADRLHTELFSKMTDSELRMLFNDRDIKTLNTVDMLHELYVGDMEFEDDVEAMSYMDVMNYIGNHHVHRVDQFTMEYSIEARFPFLDHKVVETAYRIPSSYKYRQGEQKYILREVAKKYIAPECLSMKKKGFSMPLARWMHGELAMLLADKLRRLRERENINGSVVAKWENDFQSGRFPAGKLWHLVMLELWYESFIDR